MMNRFQMSDIDKTANIHFIGIGGISMSGLAQIVLKDGYGVSSSDWNKSAITEKLENAKKLLDTIENLPIVTVAAINGGCFGGGLETALSCQFRICSPKAFLGLPEIMHGVIPGMAGIERLAKLIGKEKTVSMCLSGEILSAQKALEYNLVSSVTAQKDALPEAIEFTKEIIAGKSKLQIECIIDTINQTLNGIPNASKGKFETVLKQH